jgi:hypothetical protein
MSYASMLESIQRDLRYVDNLDWGEPRHGHPEGTVRAHIAELEGNLEKLSLELSEESYWKLKVLIHTHDTFKKEAERGVAITHPRSHASLARAFLAEFCDDEDLLTIVQYHDEPYALWRQVKQKGRCDQQRLEQLVHRIADWDLFLRFCVIDGCTTGKSRAPLRWFLAQAAERVHTSISVNGLLEALQR